MSELNIDADLCARVIGRIITKNTFPRAKRDADRLQFLRNIASAESVPLPHLAHLFQAIEKFGETYEMGIMFGYLLALGSGRKESRKVIEQMLADIAHEQDSKMEDKEDGHKEDAPAGDQGGSEQVEPGNGESVRGGGDEPRGDSVPPVSGEPN